MMDEGNSGWLFLVSYMVMRFVFERWQARLGR
jgi:hypothetical protein